MSVHVVDIMPYMNAYGIAWVLGTMLLPPIPNPVADSKNKNSGIISENARPNCYVGAEIRMKSASH